MSLISSITGWRRVFLISARNYKTAYVSVLATRLLGTTFDLLAFGAILLGIGHFTGTPPAWANAVLEALGSDGAILVSVTVMFVILKSIGMGFSFWNSMLVARYRQDIFADFLKRVVLRIQDNPTSSYVSGLGAKNLSRVLRRETRYVSRSVSDSLQLLPHLIIVMLIGGFAIVKMPAAAGIVAIGILLSLPFHLRAGRWGARNIDDLITSGMKKGEADRAVVEKLITYPSEVIGQSNDMIEHDYVNDDRVMRFLNAYGDRAKLAPISQLISSSMTLVVLAALAIYLLTGLLDDRFTATEVTGAIIAVRFFAASATVLAQILTNVASFSPLIDDLLDFIEVGAEDGSVAFGLEPGQRLSKRCIVVDDGPLGVPLVASLCHHWKMPLERCLVLYSTLRAHPQNLQNEFVEGMFRTEWSFLSEATRKMILGETDIPTALDLSIGQLRYILSALRASPKSAVIWEAKGLLKLPLPDRIGLLEWFSDRKIAIHFQNVPANLPSLSKYIVWTVDDGRLTSVGRAVPETLNLLTELRVAKPEVSNPAVDHEEDDDDYDA